MSFAIRFPMPIPLLLPLLLLASAAAATAPIPSASTGSVEVLAAPGSAVFVDGVLRGRTGGSGAAEIADVPVGRHRVLVTHPERLPRQIAVTVRADAVVRADLSRVRALPAARIEVDDRRPAVGWDRLDRLPRFTTLLTLLLLASVVVFWLSYRVDRWIRGD